MRDIGGKPRTKKLTWENPTGRMRYQTLGKMLKKKSEKRKEKIGVRVLELCRTRRGRRPRRAHLEESEKLILGLLRMRREHETRDGKQRTILGGKVQIIPRLARETRQ